MGPWPLPALVTWALAWAVCLGLRALAAPAWLVWAVPFGLGVWMALRPAVATTGWQRIWVAGGFPLSALLSAPAHAQAGGLGAWVWLMPLAVLLLAYPVTAWRDAPVFPTPQGALAGLPDCAALPASARILDAGCGLGDGLIELQRAYPAAQLHGIEWSWPWRWVCALRCPWARVWRADMWAADWSGYDLVYLFQRPESMPRALAKARREMRPGSWLVSLEFAASDAQGRAEPAHARLTLAGGRPLWVYRPAG